MGESYACEVCLNKAVVNLKNRPLRCALCVFVGFFYFFPDAELPLFAIRSCFEPQCPFLSRAEPLCWDSAAGQQKERVRLFWEQEALL